MPKYELKRPTAKRGASWVQYAVIGSTGDAAVWPYRMFRLRTAAVMSMGRYEVVKRVRVTVISEPRLARRRVRGTAKP